MSGLHAIERGNDVQMTTAIRLATFYGKQVCALWAQLQPRRDPLHVRQDEVDNG